MMSGDGMPPCGYPEACESRQRVAFLSWYDSPAVAKVHLACMIAAEFLPRLVSGDLDWCRRFLDNPYAHAVRAGLDNGYLPSFQEIGYDCTGTMEIRMDRRFEYEFYLAIFDLVTAAYCIENRLIVTSAVIRTIDHISLAHACHEAECPSPDRVFFHLDSLIARCMLLLTPNPDPSGAALADLEIWAKSSYEVPRVNELFDPLWQRWKGFALRDGDGTPDTES